MTKIVLTFLLFSATCVGYSQKKVDSGKEKLNIVCDQFMQAFREGKYPQAIDLLRANSVIEPPKLDTLEAKISKQMEMLPTIYGSMVSWEFITKHEIKDFISRRYYILKFKNYYLKFDFTLYNSGSGWTITGFTYNDDLIELLY